MHWLIVLMDIARHRQGTIFEGPTATPPPPQALELDDTARSYPRMTLRRAETHCTAAACSAGIFASMILPITAHLLMSSSRAHFYSRIIFSLFAQRIFSHSAISFSLAQINSEIQCKISFINIHNDVCLQSIFFPQALLPGRPATHTDCHDGRRRCQKMSLHI